MKKITLVLLIMMLTSITFIGVVSAEENNELSVWAWDPAFNVYALEEAAEIYKENVNSDFELNIEEQGGGNAVRTKLTTAFTSGQTDSLPDVVLIEDASIKKFLTNYPNQFYSLTNSSIDFSDFADYKVGNSTLDEETYAVPFDNGAVINAMRTDILDEAGYTIKDFENITWKEYIEKGKKVLEITGKPLLAESTGNGEPDILPIMLQSAGTWLFDENGDAYISNNDTLKEIIKVYVELVDTGVLELVNGWDQYISAFQQGNVASVMNGAWIIGSIKQQENQKGDWGITNIPRLNEIEGATNYSNQGGSSWLLLDSSNKKELAVDFLTNTFAGSTELYETILPESGAIATYLPAGNSSVYNESQEFFGGQKVYADILNFASKVPQINYGIYSAEATDAVFNAVSKVMSGASIDSALKEADNTVDFMMGN